jgi:heme-degrading monooxygenase HmoA
VHRDAHDNQPLQHLSAENGDDAPRQETLIVCCRSDHGDDESGTLRCHHVRSIVADRSVNEREGGGVFARITTFEGRPERVTEFRHAMEEHVLPALRRLPGFQGVLFLADHESGKVLGVALWETEESMRASEESAYWFRSYGAEAASERITGVERYEIILSDLERVQP